MKTSSSAALVAVIAMAILIGCTEAAPVPKAEPPPPPPQDEPDIEDLVVPDSFLGVWKASGPWCQIRGQPPWPPCSTSALRGEFELIVTRTTIVYKYSERLVAEFFSYNSEDVLVLSRPGVDRYFIRGTGDQEESPSLHMVRWLEDPDTRLRVRAHRYEMYFYKYKQEPGATEPPPPQDMPGPQDEAGNGYLVVPDSFFGEWHRPIDGIELVITRTKIAYRHQDGSISELFPDNSEDALIFPYDFYVGRYVIRGTGDDKLTLYIIRWATDPDTYLRVIVNDIETQLGFLKKEKEPSTPVSID